MIRVMRFETENIVVQTTDRTHLVPPKGGELCWFDIAEGDELDLKALQQGFGFHPLVMEGCLRHRPRPELSDYKNYLFLAMQALQYDRDPAPQLRHNELFLFLGERYLITIHRQPIQSLEEVWNRLSRDPKSWDGRGIDYICQAVMDAFLESTYTAIDHLSDELLALENRVLATPDRKQLVELMRLKRSLVVARRMLTAERDVMAGLARYSHGLINERNMPYFRESYDRLVRACEQVDLERDLLGNAMDAYHSMVANRLNVIVKQLTILTAIFMPPTFITGFFGQNFTVLPFNSRIVFGIEIAACISLPILMLHWFYRSGWIGKPDFPVIPGRSEHSIHHGHDSSADKSSRPQPRALG